MPEMIHQAVLPAAAGEELQHAIVVNLPTGERAFDLALRPVSNQGGKVIGIVPEAVETTQRVKAEEALRQSRRWRRSGSSRAGSPMISTTF